MHWQHHLDNSQQVYLLKIVVVQSLSHVGLFVTP